MIKANDITRKSWIKYDHNSHFPIQNIPFGVFKSKKNDNETIHIGSRIGETAISLSRLEQLHYFDALPLKKGTFTNNTNLNEFLKQNKKIWRLIRDEIAEIFDEKNQKIKENIINKEVLFPINEIQSIMPVKIGDYTDFYSSKDHAMNVGKMFRDPENALLPNWLHIPVGYHGRASSIILSGEKIKRPSGQILPKGSKIPIFSKSKLLDFELEMAFITGQGKPLGNSISTDEAEKYIFGLCLFNDWSARDIQKFEYVPLGPFLGKSFASSISPWIITLDALEPFKTKGETQQQPISPYLNFNGLKNYDVNLEVIIQTLDGINTKISNSNFKYMYWNMCQQLAHHTINGCNINAGDLMASGTISGPKKEEYGSMLELSWAGTQEVKLKNGESRKFLMDDDTLIMRGCAQNKYIKIGFGEVKNQIIG
tara:strand:- start:5609 stop:6883 length:1275 start_codon:yes stop_codon:yes gene_type:complete